MSEDTTIRRLSEMVDLVALMNVVGRKSRYGRKPGPTAWHYTTEYILSFGVPQEHVATVIALFKSLGVETEKQAGLWLAEHMDQIP